MSEINVVSRTQTIVVEPVSTSVSVIHTGLPGRDGVGASLSGYLMAKHRISPSQSFPVSPETLVAYDLLSAVGWTVSGSIITCTLAGRYYVSSTINLRHTGTISILNFMHRLRHKRGSETIIQLESDDNSTFTNTPGDEARSAFSAHGIFDFAVGDNLQVVVQPSQACAPDVFGTHKSILTIIPIGAAGAEASDDDWATATTQTTDATGKVILEIPVPLSSVMMVESHTLARRVGGVAGTLGDGAMYVRYAAAHNPSGSANYIGSISATVTQETVGAANYNVSWGFGTPATSIFLTVLGALDTIVDWKTWYRIKKLP